MRRAAAISLVALALAGCGGDDDSTTAAPEPGFDANRAFEDLRAQVEIGPRPAGSPAAHETAELIAGRMHEAGLEAVSIQAPRENVLGTIPGDLPGTVIVGAHYDTEDIPRFVGANDGASGVAVLLELARALPARLAGPSVQLVAFDAEESPGDSDFDRFGTRGSRQYVDYARAGGEQGSAPLNEIRAMVLFDMVGDCDLQIPYEQNSDEDLYALFAVTAAELNNGNADPFRFNTFPVGDDHEPFLEAGIPAVDFIDFTYGPGAPPGLYWHTPKDTIDKVCPASLDTVGEVALRAIPKIR
jgi:Zn-dependent M28 family amino/carboxypeptidase